MHLKIHYTVDTVYLKIHYTVHSVQLKIHYTVRTVKLKLRMTEGQQCAHSVVQWFLKQCRHVEEQLARNYKILLDIRTYLGPDIISPKCSLSGLGSRTIRPPPTSSATFVNFKSLRRGSQKSQKRVTLKCPGAQRGIWRCRPKVSDLFVCSLSQTQAFMLPFRFKR